MANAAECRREVFSTWLRTGRRPQCPETYPIEVKFNPWHDPQTGRFTFAGAGNHFGRGSVTPARPRRVRTVERQTSNAATIRYFNDPFKRQLATREEADAWRVEQLAKYGDTPANQEIIEDRYQRYIALLPPVTAPPPQPEVSAHPISDFAEGAAEGAYDVGKGVVSGAYSLVTNHPLTTLKNIEFGVARPLHALLAAEDTSAYVHFNRAADALSRASAHDIGYGVGSTAANIGLVIAPNAAAAKVAAATRSSKVGAVVTATEEVSSSVVPRIGPKDVDPLRHNANVLVRNASGAPVVHQRFVSGNMTVDERALGFPRNTLASHTEARAVRTIEIGRGDTMTITGQSPPCKVCRGTMRRAATEKGATIKYQWRESGKTKIWIALPE